METNRNNSLDRVYRPIVDRTQAIELPPEEKLSDQQVILDLDIIDLIEEKARELQRREVITELDYEMFMDVIKECGGLGSREYYVWLNWLNEKDPGDPILIPSDYGITPGAIEPPDWLIPGLVLREGLTLFWGSPGSWKTILTIYMGHALRTGTDFFGIPIEGKYRVVYVEQDEGGSIFKDQIQKMGIDEDEFVLCKLPVAWAEKHLNKEFHDSVKALRPDVVVIDALASLGIANINDGSSGHCLDALRRIAAEKKLSIIIIHHEGKSKEEQVGSVFHIAKIDSEVRSKVVATEGDVEQVTLSQGKVRGERLEPIFLKANKRTLCVERQLNMTIARMVRMLKVEGLDKKDILSRFHGKDKEAAKKAYQRSSQRGE